MMRKWTLVSAFAALALVSWAQPPRQPAESDATPAERPVQRVVPQDARPTNRVEKDETPAARERRAIPDPTPDPENTPTVPQRAPGATPNRATDQLVRPGQADPSPADAAKTPFLPPVMPRGPKDASPAEIEKNRRQREAQQSPGAVTTPSTTEASPSPAGSPVGGATEGARRARERAREIQQREGVTPGQSPAASPSTGRPPGDAATPPTNGTPAGPPSRRITPRAGDTPATLQTPDRTPGGTATPDAAVTPRVTPDASPAVTPRVTPDASPAVTPRITPDASPAVTPDASPAVTPRATGTPDVSPSPDVTPRTTVTPDASPSPAVTPRGTAAPTPDADREILPTPAGGTPAPGETPRADATPFVPTNMPGRLRDRRPADASPSPTTPTPASTDATPATGTPTPAAGTGTPSAGTPIVQPTPQSLEQRQKQASERAQRRAERREKAGEEKAVTADQAKPEDLNRAAELLLNKGERRGQRDPAKAELTPWVQPKVTVVENPQEVDASAQSGAIVILPAGATPTPTPAPERIIVEDKQTIINNIQNITIAPTPPPAPTPGPTPVPPPPGVTPVPDDFRPPRDWVPFPGWRPPNNWNPPQGWVPPGGWSPPPGWTAPSPEWTVRLRNWGWSYIPRRGWVVPVQWTPPPDFVVPPNWYYLPTDSYDDYGFYDPSEVVVLPGQARPDLQVNINVTEVYNPPAPPPIVVQEAPPPPPRPAPLQPPPVPEEITRVEEVVEVFSRERVPSAPRYAGPVLVTESVHFEYDSYAIQPDSFPTLNAIGQALVEEMPEAIINVEGHTDSDGSEEYNQTLSEQRAWSVKSYLVQQFGLDPNRLIIVGYGERSPISSNSSDSGKARNRRVEFENVTDLYSAQVVETAAPENY